MDDEEVLAFLWKQVLEELGYTAEVRTINMEALESFRQAPETFHAVIRDMTMPHMSREMLVRELLQIRPHLPIIFALVPDAQSVSARSRRTEVESV